MSAFTDIALIKKLADLNSSQQSIQTLSLWLIHHRKHHVTIVKTWQNILRNVPEAAKLTFLYLANDIIQNSKKKGPEYGKEFASVLPQVFTHIAETCTSEKLFESILRILHIWKERGVYEPSVIAEYRVLLNKGVTDGRKKKSTEATEHKIGSSGSSGGEHKDREKSETKRDKRKSEEQRSTKSKRSRNHIAATEESQPVAVGESENGHVSPYVPLGEPPESEELIKMLQSLENSASSDAVVRERIANLPPEISEINCLSKIDDKDKAKQLAVQVNEAVELLNEYNGRLSAEMEKRTSLASMLRAYQAEQKELLAKAEQRLDEHKKKLSKILAVQKEIRDHLSNLPDLTQLPDVTGGLAPLPSAGDLFNIH